TTAANFAARFQPAKDSEQIAPRNSDRFAIQQLPKDNAIALQQFLADRFDCFGTHTFGMFHAKGVRTYTHPTPSFIHAVDRLSSAPSAFHLAVRRLTKRRQQRAQASEAVGGDETAKY